MKKQKQQGIKKRLTKGFVKAAVIGAIASVAAIAYIVYRYFGCRYLNDFDGDFDYDELDDDFDFDEEDDIEKKPKNTDE